MLYLLYPDLFSSRALTTIWLAVCLSSVSSLHTLLECKLKEDKDLRASFQGYILSAQGIPWDTLNIQ